MAVLPLQETGLRGYVERTCPLCPGGGTLAHQRLLPVLTDWRHTSDIEATAAGDVVVPPLPHRAW